MLWDHLYKASISPLGATRLKFSGDPKTSYNEQKTYTARTYTAWTLVRVQHLIWLGGHGNILHVPSHFCLTRLGPGL